MDIGGKKKILKRTTQFSDVNDTGSMANQKNINQLVLCMPEEIELHLP